MARQYHIWLCALLVVGGKNNERRKRIGGGQIQLMFVGREELAALL